MTTEINELIEQLDARFGNPYAPKHYHIVQEAIEYLTILNAENVELKEQLTFSYDGQ